MRKLILMAGILFIFGAAGVARAEENMSGIWDEDGQSQTTSEVSSSQIMYAQFGRQLQAIGFLNIRAYRAYGAARAR